MGRDKELDRQANALRERCGSLHKLLTEKMKVISASLSFHQNMKNVSVLGIPLL